jgi:hypothetical protein
MGEPLTLEAHVEHRPRELVALERLAQRLLRHLHAIVLAEGEVVVVVGLARIDVRAHLIAEARRPKRWGVRVSASRGERWAASGGRRTLLA